MVRTAQNNMEKLSSRQTIIKRLIPVVAIWNVNKVCVQFWMSMNKSMTAGTQTDQIRFIICSSKSFGQLVMYMKSVGRITLRLHDYTTALALIVVFETKPMLRKKCASARCLLTFFRTFFKTQLRSIKKLSTHCANLLFYCRNGGVIGETPFTCYMDVVSKAYRQSSAEPALSRVFHDFLLYHHSINQIESR